MPGDKTTRGERPPVTLLPGGAVEQGLEPSLDDALSHMRETPGLSSQQRKFLALRLLYATDKEAAAAVGETRTVVWDWKQQPVFKEQYHAIIEAGVDGVVAYAKRELKRLAGRIPQTIAEMLDAEEEIPLKDGGTLKRPAWLARGKAIELLQRPLGMWSPEAAADAGNPVAIEAMRLMHDLVQRRVERETGDSGAIEGEVVRTASPFGLSSRSDLSRTPEA
ncbi:MAG: hypothetical protein NTZ05_14380 [Chloroflexi bacterium]|nr:hypothetical protein [Chloroflexota bacterium]